MNILLQKKSYRAIFALCFIILVSFFLPDSLLLDQKQAILIFLFAVLFWAFEIIPLYATSLCVVLLLTFFLTGLEIGQTREFSTFLVSFSNPVIMLFFGGFVLAECIKKHGLDLYLTSKLLSKISNKPFSILFSYLFISAFFSMWISNTASCAMMLLLVKPLLNEFKKDDPFVKALTLAIAFGANIGGIGTPIGTPPNAIALGILKEYGVNLNFLNWMIMAVPLAVGLLIIAGLILLFFFPSKEKTIKVPKHKVTALSIKAKGVCAIATFVIVLWLTNAYHHIPEAIVALLGVALFSAFNLIDHQDLKNLDWDILLLMWGGLALGLGIQKTGLLSPLLQTQLFSQHVFFIVGIFCILAFILSSFMSNTATANLLLPIVILIPGQNQILLSITVALSCSFALAFPISTPPNAMVYSLRTFSTKDMFKAGFCISIIGIILVLLGFDFFITKSFQL